MSRKPLPMLALLASSQCFALSGHAQADWGYEEKTSASPAQASSAKAAEAKRPASALKPKAQTAGAPLKKAQVAPSEAKVKVILDERRCWLELFALCASSANEDDRKEVLDIATLSLDQKNRLTKFIDAKLAAPESSFVGLVPIWTKLRSKILEEMDIKESYRLLFRALLRHFLSKSHETTSEIEMLQDLLGAVRIADSGPPILTEDAVNAYADMTCYLYQKRKPDRSVDGDDNRQTFALVVKDRFTRAPNLAAKTAMTNFDLTWACFRCRFLDVSTEQQEKLSALMASGDNKSSAQLKAELVSPTMLKIFALGPWSEKAKELKEEKATAGKLDTK